MTHMGAEPRGTRTVSRFSLAYLRGRRECVFLLTPGGRISFVSDSVRTRLPNADRLAGRDWWDLWPEDTRDAQRGAVRDASRGNALCLRVAAPDGADGPDWEQTLSPIHNSDGGVESVLAVLRPPAGQPGESG